MSFLHLSLLRNHTKTLATQATFSLTSLTCPYSSTSLEFNMLVAMVMLCFGTVALSVLFATQPNLSTSTCHLSVMNELLNAVLFANNVNFWNYMYMHFFIKSLIILFTLIHFYHICIFCMYSLNVCVLMYLWCSYSHLPVFYLFLFLLCFLLVLAFYRFTHLFSPFLFYAFLFLPLISWWLITVWFWSRTGWRVSIWGAAVRMSLRFPSFLFGFLLCSWKLTNNSKTSPKNKSMMPGVSGQHSC